MKNYCVDPCCRCSRVPDPDNCENLHCTTWRTRYIQRWEEMRRQCRCRMDTVETVPLGVPLGGFHYAHPHRIREYRQQNPCHTCAVAPLCREKCKVRLLWEQQGGMQ